MNLTLENIVCPLCGTSNLLIQELHRKCNACLLWFLLPEYHLDEASEKERYLLHEHFDDDKGYQEYLKPLFEALLQMIPSGSNGLDFGSGPASCLGKMLKNVGFHIESYDPYSAPNQSLLERQYDFVFASEVCEHFYQPRKEFLKLRELVKPGGTLGIMTKLTDGIDFKNWYYQRDPTHVVFYSKVTFEWIVKNLSWKSMRIIGDRTIVIN